jgi:hypothetical protein
VSVSARITRLANAVDVAGTSRRLADTANGLSATLALIFATIIWMTYYRYQPLWVEHAAYGMWANLQFHEALVREGYIHALSRSLGTRHVLQPAVLGLVPRMLSWPHAHVLVTALGLYLFVFLLGRYSALRTGSAATGAIAALLFCTLSGLYDEAQGMGVPWPDYQSMFFLSSAVMSVALSALSGKAGWLGLAGASITLATLARDTGAIYAAVTTVPLVAWLGARELRSGGWSRAGRMISWFALPALPAAWLLFRNVQFFQQYYMTSNAWQLRHPIGLVVTSIFASIVHFCGALPLASLAVLGAAGLFIGPRDVWNIGDAIVIYWPVSFLALLVVNGYDATGVTKEVMYVAPALVCIAATIRGGIDLRFRAARIVVASVLMISMITCGSAITKAYNRARHPDAEALALREDQRRLAEVLASIPGQIWWHSYTNYDWGTVVAALTFYEFGHYQPTENVWFHNKKSYWDAIVPRRDLPQLEDYVWSETEKRVDVAIVLRDAETKPHGMEDYSFSIASSMATRMKRDPVWKHDRDVLTSVSGPLSFYVNRGKTER